ncbi:MAG: hypothetical protein LUD83_00330 [Clostridiales bacterium]|nr:hypothetical protein [Clostridiales bacterium]
MNSLHFETVVLSKTITVELLPAGQDWNVLISGGDAPHVGSVSVARPDSGGGVCLEKLVLPTHKDDYVGDRYATALAALTGRTVAVSCGIHYDGLSKSGIAQVMEAMEGLLARVCAALGGEIPPTEIAVFPKR